MALKKNKRPTVVFGEAGKKSRFLQLNLENPIIAWLLLSLFFASLTFLLSPSFRSTRPRLAAGEIAKKTHVVRVEFTVQRPNKDAERQREKLAQQVPPYYEFQREPASHAITQIHAAFNRTRPLYQDYVSSRERLKQRYAQQIRQAQRAVRAEQKRLSDAQKRNRRGAVQTDARLLEPLMLRIEKAKLRLSFLQQREQLDLRAVETRSEAQLRSVFLETLQVEGGLNQEDVRAFIDNGFS
ncbi:MAG: hypothetical protein KC492_43235, partial [Myxococcales bacterium]|nr:hypothetical protein [Myxococcales bacterium]